MSFIISVELQALGHKVTLFAPANARTSAKQVSFISRSLLKRNDPWQAESEGILSSP